VHAGGGTALDINNGSIKVSGAVRAAFVYQNAVTQLCAPIDHPLLNGDPNAMVFVTTKNGRGTAASVVYDLVPSQWSICMGGDLVYQGERYNVLVIKQ
jgi:hypothetical protein